MKYNEISARQFFILTFGLTVGTSILITPIGYAHTAREDAWIASLFSLLVNLVMVVIYIALARLYPGKSLFDIFESTAGKVLGKLITLIYLFYFLLLTGTLLGNLGFFMSSEMMPETPIESIQYIFMAAAIICARKGIIILARFGELVFPWIIFLFTILVLTLLPKIDWNYIKPMLEVGWSPIMKAGFQSSMFQELIALLVFFPMLHQKKQGERAFMWGVVSGSMILFIIVMLSILVLGIEQTENSTFPAYALAKTINIGNFLQRVEGILITIWIMTFFIKISVIFISILRGMGSMFGTSNQRYLIYPVAAIIVVVAWNTYINTVYVNDIIERVWGKYSFCHLLIIPLLLLAIGLIRTKFGPKRKNNQLAEQGQQSAGSS